MVWSLFFPAITSSQAALLDGKRAASDARELSSFNLMDRMNADLNSGEVEVSGGRTDPLTTLTHIFKSIVRANSELLHTTSSQWVEAFLEFVDRRPDASLWRKHTNVKYITNPPGGFYCRLVAIS